MVQEQVQSLRTSGQMLSTAGSLGMTDVYIRQWMCLVAADMLTSLHPTCPQIPALGKQEEGTTNHTIFPPEPSPLRVKPVGSSPSPRQVLVAMAGNRGVGGSSTFQFLSLLSNQGWLSCSYARRVCGWHVYCCSSTLSFVPCCFQNVFLVC